MLRWKASKSSKDRCPMVPLLQANIESNGLQEKRALPSVYHGLIFSPISFDVPGRCQLSLGIFQQRSFLRFQDNCRITTLTRLVRTMLMPLNWTGEMLRQSLASIRWSCPQLVSSRNEDLWSQIRDDPGTLVKLTHLDLQSWYFNVFHTL